MMRLNRLLQLEAAAADIGQFPARDPDLGAVGHHRAGFVDLFSVYKDHSRHDQRFRPLAAGRQALFCQKDVQSVFAHDESSSCNMVVIESWSRRYSARRPGTLPWRIKALGRVKAVKCP